MDQITLKDIPKRQLGINGPHVSAVGLGTMGIGAFYGTTNHEEAMEALTFAADHGITLWDSAETYGITEEVIGKWFASSGRRNEIFLVTKFGGWDPEAKFAPPYTAVSKPSYIQYAFERSLKHLQTDHIDLYMQHRVDPNVPIEVVVETLRPYVERGQIKWLGLSECSVDTLRRAKTVKGLGEKIIAVQDEFNPFSLHIEKDGIVDVCKELGVSIIAYSPLGRGMLTGKYHSRADFEKDDLRQMLPRFSDENFPKNLSLVNAIKEIADKYNATTSQVAIAWILASHPTFIPIPGSRWKHRIEENSKGALLQLSPEDVKEIRRLCETAEVYGDRYPEPYSQTVIGNCIKLDEWKGE